ncbi:MAG: hypothetical protein NC926_06695 [Candidatus Omnitrophica bacterium]|nr:hypothetical protein [Candidatus Omnitrophota bacterium]
MEDDFLCEFNCSIKTEKCGQFIGRIVVTHSGWAAIYDENFNFTCSSFLIVGLPKRNYNYVARIGIYDGKNFESTEKTVFC